MKLLALYLVFCGVPTLLTFKRYREHPESMKSRINLRSLGWVAVTAVVYVIAAAGFFWLDSNWVPRVRAALGPGFLPNLLVTAAGWTVFLLLVAAYGLLVEGFLVCWRNTKRG